MLPPSAPPPPPLTHTHAPLPAACTLWPLARALPAWTCHELAARWRTPPWAQTLVGVTWADAGRVGGCCWWLQHPLDLLALTAYALLPPTPLPTHTQNLAVVIEGMGRAIHTNYATLLRCPALKLAMIKNAHLAERLFGGQVYDCMCRFDAAQEF